MTSQRDFKRLVRARMDATGERYTTARAALLRQPAARVDSSAPARLRPSLSASTPSRPSRRFAAPAGRSVAAPGMSDAAVKAKTGCDWSRWVWALDREQAYEWTHREIARHVHEKYKLNSWWSQTVTVGYERIKGLREPGQARGGLFRMSKTRTLPVAAGTLYRLVRDARSRRRWLPDLALEIRSVTPGKMIRARLASGVRLEFRFTPKGARNCQLVVEELGLPDRAAIVGRKEYWARRLGEIGES